MCIKYREEPDSKVYHIKTRDHCISFCIKNYLSLSSSSSLRNISLQNEDLDCLNYFSVATDAIFSDTQNLYICPHDKQVLILTLIIKLKIFNYN